VTKREKIREAGLDAMESEFSSLLLLCLQQCARGRWGLFGQNDGCEFEERYLVWSEARRLKELAEEIQGTRLEFGEVNSKCEQFLQLCSLRGPHVLSEPKLAAKFLAEIT
jgi:hypothetical protein